MAKRVHPKTLIGHGEPGLRPALKREGPAHADTLDGRLFSGEPTGEVRDRGRAVEAKGSLPHEQAELHLPTGTVIAGTYELREVIGVGGMAVVYEALDRLINRVVAIKVSRPNVPPDVLRREVQALGAFHHAGVVTVHAAGTFRGRDYLVMERIHGQSLADLMDRLGTTRMPIGQAIDILIGIAEPLAVMHEAGLVHRDLKPSNTMLTAGQRVVLVDFGIARLDRFDPVGGPIAGSLHYMAPETLHDDRPEGGAARVDVYALGVIAFQLLTMQLPSSSAPAAHVGTVAADGSGPRPGAIVADLPPALDTLVSAMLSERPEGRPADAGAALERLREIRRGLTRTTTGAISVLVCDDDPAMVALLVTCVRQARPAATIRTAATAAEARRHLARDAPSLLLLDLQLPDVSGLELMMELAGGGALARTEVALVSNRCTPADRRVLGPLGVSHFVAKRTTTMTSWPGIVLGLIEHAERSARTRPLR